jgi:glucose/arabinose dehydrogenase
VSTANERGLLGLAFHPADPALAYVDWTDRAGAITLSEFRVGSAGTDGRFDPASERVLLRLPKRWNDHNGGSLAFDPEGRLYVGVGDGGGVGDGPKGVGDPQDNAQRLDTLFGKILRIDPRPPAGGGAYAIPAGNPFVGQRGARPEIWALGLRNPWRTFLDATDGVLWVADVGQSKWEELDRVPLATAGANLGWRRTEGLAPYRGGASRGDWLKPVHVYPHADRRCAVIGGAVYRGRALAPLDEWFVFGDLCAGTFSALRPGPWTAHDLGTRVASLTSIGPGPDGELYATALNGGVFRLDPA